MQMIFNFIFDNFLLVVGGILIWYIVVQYKDLKEKTTKIKNLFEKTLNPYLEEKINEAKTVADEIKEEYVNNKEIETEITRLMTIIEKGITGTINEKVETSNTINKYKAPVSMKEEAYGLLNRKIALVALADETRYKLKRLKPFGNARRELVRTLRKTERDIRHNDKEIRYMIKRIKGYETRFEEHKGRAKLLIAIVLILAALISSVLLFGDDVAAYFTDLISKFGA